MGMAYRAYLTLHRLISPLPPVVSLSSFTVRRESESEPLNAWWHHYLDAGGPLFGRDPLSEDKPTASAPIKLGGERGTSVKG